MKRYVLVALVLLAAFAVFTAINHPHPAVPPVRTTTPTASTSSPAGDLAITAIRAHPLTPGAITVEQQLAPRSGCATAVVSYHSDGYKIFALETRPPTPPPAGGYPVLILAHGYIDPTQYQTTGTDYASFIAAYCAQGYLVLKPDYRGNGHSEGIAVGGHFSPAYTYDILNLAASLRSLPQADSNRIALLGHSMGGHVVLRALVATHGLPIKAAVFASGVVGSLQDIAYHWPSPVPSDIPPVRDQVIAQHGSPQQDPTFWHDASAINYVSAVPCPVQINHGSADTVVPLAFSQHLDTALSAAHIPHEFHIYPGGDHQYTDPTIRQQFLKNSLNFLQAHL
ncbi:MAG TPA: alpha/beta fold hydrolase [Candidatus Saccharimonadia bacterium]|jgi:dipeptidyl aminopeptidase/acylaminoacyl peptidase